MTKVKSNTSTSTSTNIKTKRMKRCDCCGQLKPDVVKTCDPYENDVNNNYVEMKLCDECCAEMAAEI